MQEAELAKLQADNAVESSKLGQLQAAVAEQQQLLAQQVCFVFDGQLLAAH